ncbi:MAG: FUSC family protein [Janthinobacterium lividum]
MTPRRAEIIYSLKCFAGSMLALYAAEYFGLPRPFWAMMTAYIVANPMTGTVRSKALYRCGGTLVGSSVTVLIVPQLANAPELLSLALALWVGLCLYISLLDRTPRSYFFMLAGYTAGLIGFPVVADPTTVFDVALARSEEITLGIVCATMVHTLILSQSLGAALLARVNQTFDDARGWIRSALRIAPLAAVHKEGAEPAAVVDAWRKLAADITELRLMASHLPFDTSSLRWMSGTVHALHDRLALMVPLLLSIEDRLRTLEQIDPASLTPQWRALAADIQRWVALSALEQGSPDASRAGQLRAQIEQLMPALGEDVSWSTLLQLNLAVRLRSLVDTIDESRSLQRQLDDVLHGRRADRSVRLAGTSTWGLHRDHGMALRSAFAAVIATTACCAFWIITGWPSGAAAAMLAAVFCCFFAAMDDPAPNIQSFLDYTIYSIPISAFYLLVVLPAIHSFEMLVMTLAPVFLLIGIFLARPACMGRALALIFGVCGTLSLQDTNSSDMVSFTNGMLAQIVGVFAAVLFTRLLRSATAQQVARRLMRAARKELTRISARTRAPNLLAMSALMLDRIALLAPRLALAGPQADPGAFAALCDLRVGLNMAQLRHVQAGDLANNLPNDLSNRFSGSPLKRSRGLLPGRLKYRQQPHGLQLSELMTALHQHFLAPVPAAGAMQAGSAALLGTLDDALRNAVRHGAGAGTHAGMLAERDVAVAALVSIRRDLFPDAPFFVQLPLPAAAVHPMPAVAAHDPGAAPSSPHHPTQEQSK